MYHFQDTIYKFLNKNEHLEKKYTIFWKKIFHFLKTKYQLYQFLKKKYTI